MGKFTKLTVVLAMAATLGACGAIDTGNSGVRISWDNKVNMNEMGDGFYTSIISSVEEWTGKEIMIALEDMTPKAAGNLKMQELDVEVYYTAEKSSHADLKVKYVNAHAYENGIYYPAYKFVRSQVRSATYKSVGTMDSLVIHKNRAELENLIKEKAQALLNDSDPDVFTVTKVLVKKANTDPTLEKAIQLAIKKDKELEAAMKNEQIRAADARANVALASSLTPEIMRIKELDAMVAACPKNTCILDFTDGTGPQPLINIRN